MSELRRSGSERGSFGWAFATVASTLATGAATREVSCDDLWVAADVVVNAFRDLGHEVVLLPEAVWNLSSLAPGESLSFAQAAVASILDRHNLAVVWEEAPGS
ncbi:MAG: hypothetical protein WEE66_07940 [Actinomycetota bacterium]